MRISPPRAASTSWHGIRVSLAVTAMCAVSRDAFGQFSASTPPACGKYVLATLAHGCFTCERYAVFPWFAAGGGDQLQRFFVRCDQSLASGAVGQRVVVRSGRESDRPKEYSTACGGNSEWSAGHSWRRLRHRFRKLLRPDQFHAGSTQRNYQWNCSVRVLSRLAHRPAGGAPGRKQHQHISRWLP